MMDISKFPWAVVLMTLLSACTPVLLNTQGPVRPDPRVIGHAGSGFFTPLNPFNPLPPSSLAGVRRALARGAEGVEVDVQLSQDSVPILYHDTTLDNMTRSRGCVSQYPAAALQQLRYRGGWPYDWFQQERVATLEELLQLLAQQPNYPALHLDLHEHDACAPAGQAYRRSPALARALGRLLRRYQVPLAQVLLVTEHAESFALLRQELPGAALGLEITDQFEQRLPVAKAERLHAVVLSKKVATPERVALARAARLQVVLFGGRSGKSIRNLLATGPDAVEVDNISRMQALLRRRAAGLGQPLRPARRAPKVESVR